jgi:hypothetical protein
MSTEAANELRYEGVLLGADLVAEERGGRHVMSVPREAVRRIQLVRGPAGERLVLQSAFALLLVAIGVAAAAYVVGQLQTTGGTFHLNVAAGAMFVPLGALIMWSAFRPRYYLRVETKNDLRKVGFQTKASVEELAGFVNLAQRVHGYEVEWCIDSPRTGSSPFR